MEDRLAELIRQRALLTEHLQWLDREIARASAATSLPSLPISQAPGPLPAAESSADAESLKKIPPDAPAAASTSANLPVAAPTVSLLTSVASNPPSSPPPPAASVLGDTRVREIRHEARSGCLLWVAIGVVGFVLLAGSLVLVARWMRPNPAGKSAPEKTGALVLPLAHGDARA